ncbi:MAG: hypothetical protein K5793_07745 [Nitrosarchaeum sp.]|nr:hypothetical protein [Nitrosarchaeum sp.]
MNIGLIGLGMVGSAVRYGFEVKRGHNLFVHDLKLPDTTLENVYNNSEIIFICVSTPRNPDGSCNIDNVYEICSKINSLAENRCETKDVVIKSSVIPGTTDQLAKKLSSIRFAMNPEFLLERAAMHDFCHQDICVIGTHHNDIYDKIVHIHGNLAQEFIKTTPVNAEVVKYYCNVFNSTRIIFANMFYEIAKKVGADYDEAKKIATKRHNMIDSYLDCNEHLRGFGGACLPKDTYAIMSLSEQLGIHYNFLKGLIEDNERLNRETT